MIKSALECGLNLVKSFAAYAVFEGSGGSGTPFRMIKFAVKCVLNFVKSFAAMKSLNAH